MKFKYYFVGILCLTVYMFLTILSGISRMDLYNITIFGCTKIKDSTDEVFLNKSKLSESKDYPSSRHKPKKILIIAYPRLKLKIEQIHKSKLYEKYF